MVFWGAHHCKGLSGKHFVSVEMVLMGQICK